MTRMSIEKPEAVKRWWARSLSGALGLGVLALAACSRPAPPHKPAPAPVTVTQVAVRDMPVLLSAPGTVEAINAVAVKSQISGQLLEALVKDGADVKQGELMFRIDPRPAQAALQQALASQARDQAKLAQARAQVERYKDVAAKGYLSADEMAQYRTNLDVAVETVKADAASVAAARVDLTYTDIRAPISGRLGRIQIQPGNVVKANDTGALVTINQIEPIYVSFALPAAQIGRLQAAQKAGAPLHVQAAIDGVDERVEGAVAFIDNAVDTATGTIRLRAQFANDEHRLWPGQLVDVTLVLGHDASARVIPDRAVQQGQGGAYVFVVKTGNVAEQRKVVVARTVGHEAVIADGLSPGETVVLDGQSRVEDGAALRIETAQAGS